MISSSLLSKNINNMLASVIICFHIINGAFGFRGASITTILIVIVGMLYANWTNKLKVYKEAAILTGYILLIFSVSFFRNQDTTYTLLYIQYFLLFGVISLIIGMQKIDIRKVLRLNLWIGFIGMFIFSIRGFDAMDSGMKMGISYSMTPCILSSLIGMSDSKIYKVLSIVNVTIALMIFIIIAPRGAWLTILFFVIANFYYKISKNNTSAKNLVQRIIILIALSILAIYAINHLNSIVLWLQGFVDDKFGIKISALEKYLWYERYDNILNSRDLLWGIVIDDIGEIFIFGRGIGSFEILSFGLHAHNIFMQALFEAGLFFLLPIFFLLIKAFRFLAFPRRIISNEEYAYYVLIIAGGIFILLFSSVYWMLVPFWYAVGYIIRYRLPLNRKHS